MQQESPDLNSLEKKLEHRFHNKFLALEALTCPNKTKNKQQNDYNRLEFLGDKVVNLALAEIIYKIFKEKNEGYLSVVHSLLASNIGVTKVAQNINLNQYIIRYEDTKADENDKSTLENVCEALMGALFLDAGYQKTLQTIQKLWKPIIKNVQEKGLSEMKDNKSKLQEWAQKNKHPIPSYSEKSRTGNHHNPKFEIVVTVANIQTTGHGYTKKAAEQKAALAAIKSLKIH